MTMISRIFGFLLFTATLVACGGDMQMGAPELSATAEQTHERGPNNGVLLAEGDFVLELAIFETGVPPEYRAWATNRGVTLEPTNFDLEVRLNRLGNVVDQIKFFPQSDYLRGDTVIYEPHSFTVSVDATYDGRSHRWELY